MTAPPYTLDDPRPIAAEAPYTFFLPSDEELATVAPGDLVQLTFRPVCGGRKWDAERMWVTVEAARGDLLEGRLESDPEDIPGLCRGDVVKFRRYEVINCIWSETRDEEPPDLHPQRDYWDRCMVDTCVTMDGKPIHFLYREEPDLAQEGDEHPDSGWRIRGDYRGLSDAEIDARETEYVAIGRVLNADDSWLHLLDAPFGSRFIRDWESGAFVPEE